MHRTVFLPQFWDNKRPIQLTLWSGQQMCASSSEEVRDLFEAYHQHVSIWYSHYNEHTTVCICTYTFIYSIHIHILICILFAYTYLYVYICSMQYTPTQYIITLYYDGTPSKSIQIAYCNIVCLTMCQWNLVLAFCRSTGLVLPRWLWPDTSTAPRHFSTTLLHIGRRHYIHPRRPPSRNSRRGNMSNWIGKQCLCWNDLMLFLHTSSSFYLHVALKGSYSCCPHHHLHVQVFQFVTSPCRMFWTNVAWILKHKVHVATLCVILLSIFFWCVDVHSGFPISMRTCSF